MASDFVADVGKCTADPREVSSRIRHSHSHHEIGDLVWLFSVGLGLFAQLPWPSLQAWYLANHIDPIPRSQDADPDTSYLPDPKTRSLIP